MSIYYIEYWEISKGYGITYILFFILDLNSIESWWMFNV